VARISGVVKGGSLPARLAFFVSRRKAGRVIEPVRIHALHTRLLLGYGQMEMAQQKSGAVPATVKSLAEIRIAMRIGCPF
jgi:hypothetical protein